MKSFLVAASFALARAECDSSESCDALADCHYHWHPSENCTFPDYKVGCCELMIMTRITCNDGNTCIRNHMRAIRDNNPGKWEWHPFWDINSGRPWTDIGPVNEELCPGSGRLSGNEESFCTPRGTESSDLLYVTPALNSLQVPEPVVLDSGCDDAASCEAETTCHIEMEAGPGQSLSCHFPHIRRACCDLFDMSMTCHNDQDCMGSHMGAMPAGELQWLQGHGNPADACPHLTALDQNAILSYCQMPSGVVAAEHMPKFSSFHDSFKSLQVPEPVDLDGCACGEYASGGCYGGPCCDGSPCPSGVVAAEHMPMAQIQPQSQNSFLTGMLGFAAGAAVVSAIAATKKKRSSDLYTPLTEESA